MSAESLFLRAIRREPADRPAVWLMRQAGRYLPEYRALRRRAGSFLKLCQTPELACEATLQPLARFELDAAIIFSDILTIPDAMGLGLEMREGEGPRFVRPLADEAAVRALAAPPLEKLDYVFQAIALARRALRVPLIGFAGSPFTLACYMIDGRGGGEFVRTRAMLHSRPDLLRRVVEANAAAVVDYLVAQHRAGADALMLFDTWGGLLWTDAYREFSLHPMREIAAAVKRQTDGAPLIVFTKGGGEWLEEIAAIGADAVGVDWRTSIANARRRIGGQVALQGNLDPAALLGTADQAAAAARRVIDEYAGVNPAEKHRGHIFNLGHGIVPQTPVENAAAAINAALECG